MTSNSSPPTNDPGRRHRTKYPWASPLVTLTFLLLGVFLCFAGVLFIYQMENRQSEQQRTDYRFIPPHLITYQQTSMFQCPILGQPTCFAVQNDSTFVIGTADPTALSFFDDSGTFLRKIDLPEEPRAVACGTSETIFTDKIVVAHPQHIAVYTIAGDHVLSLPLENFMPSGKQPDGYIENRKHNVRSLVLTPDYLFAADSGLRCIYRYDVEGNNNLGGKRVDGQVRGWGTLSWVGEAFDGFVVYASPITMTYSPQADLLYITNPGKHRIEVFTQDGVYKPELSWGEPSASLIGFAGCCNPIGLAVLDDGRILTVEKGVSRIKIFKQDGSLDCVVAGSGTLESVPPGSGRTPQKLAQRSFAATVLSDGRIAVFDFEYRTIRIFTPIAQERRTQVSQCIKTLHFLQKDTRIV